MKDFLRIYEAKYQPRELDEEVRLWLEILELVVLISYRRSDPFPLSTTVNSASTERRLAERRHYWLSARQGTAKPTDLENCIYTAYNGLDTISTHGTGNKVAHPMLSSISSLFFTISAKVASCIDQGISEQWMELAAQFMLQAALEPCLLPGSRANGENLLALSFAWGWIPPRFWDDVDSSDEISIEAEMMINNMFADDDGTRPRENQVWQRMKLKYMSLFSSPQPRDPFDIHALSTQLEKIANEYPIQEFEKKVVAFSKGMWEFCRKPLLAQIEGGEVEGMTKPEFEDFKKRIFVPP